VPEAVRGELTFVLAAHVDEVLDAALAGAGSAATAPGDGNSAAEAA